MADVNVGTVEALLRLRDELTPTLAAASKNINKFAAENKASLTLMAAGATAAIGAVTAVGAAFVAAGVQMVKHSSFIVDMADRYRMSTDAVQKLKFVAEQSGTSFEALAKGSSMLSKNLGSGSGETVAAVRALGLSFEQLRSSSPEQALTSTLKALSQVKSESVQAALGAQLLGKGFRELLPVGKDIEALSKRFEELGLKLSEKDVRAAEALGDAFHALSTVFDGFINNIGAAITSNESLHVAVEGLTTIFANLSKMVSQNRQMMADLVSGGVSLVISGISMMISVIKLAIDGWTGLQVMLLVTKGTFEILGLAAIQLWEALKNPLQAKKAWEDFNVAVDDVTKRTADAINKQMDGNEKWIVVLSKAQAEIDALGVSVKNVAGKQHEMGAATSKSTRDIELQTKAAEAAAKAAAEAAKHYEIFKQKVAGFAAESKKLEMSLGGGTSQEKALAAQQMDIMEDRAKAIRDLGAEWMKSKRPVEEFEAAIKSTIDPLTDVKMRLAENAAITEKWSGINKNHFNMMKSGYADMRAQALGWADFMSATPEVQEAILNGTEDTLEVADEWGDSLLRAADTLGGIANIMGDLQGLASSLGLGEDVDKILGGVGQTMGGAADFMAGMASGNPIAMIQGGIKAVTGAIDLGKSIAGAFSKDASMKAMEQVGRDYGVTITKELGKTIADQSKSMGIAKEMTAQLHLTEIAQQGGKEMRELAGGTGDLMNAIAVGAIPAKEGLEALNEQFMTMREEAQAAGRVGDRVMVQTIKRARELGQVTPEMKAAIGESLNLAASGAVRFAEGLAKTEDLGKINGAAAATAFAATFNAVMQEEGALAAVDAMGEHFTEFAAKMRELSPAAEGILAPIQGLIDLASGPMSGLVDAAGGLKDMLVGVADAGYLDAASFTAMQQTAASVFDQMVAGGASAADAIRVMAPTIQAAISAAEQMGVPLDADMQRLRGIAEANGIAFSTDPMMRMVQVLEAIAVKLGAELPAAANKAADALGAIQPGEIVIPYRFENQGGGLPGGFSGDLNVGEPDIAAASGFDGYVSGPTHFLAGESGRERVTITPSGGGEDATAAEIRALRADLNRVFDLLPGQLAAAQSQHA